MFIRTRVALRGTALQLMHDQDVVTPDEERLLEWAMAIADGTPVDWLSVASTPSSSSQPNGMAVRLQYLERLVQGHEAVWSRGGQEECPALHRHHPDRGTAQVWRHTRSAAPRPLGPAHRRREGRPRLVRRRLSRVGSAARSRSRAQADSGVRFQGRRLARHRRRPAARPRAAPQRADDARRGADRWPRRNLDGIHAG